VLLVSLWYRAGLQLGDEAVLIRAGDRVIGPATTRFELRPRSTGSP
jgi:mannose-6-phosphate isomerase-like protein (cupin superfamily)